MRMNALTLLEQHGTIDHIDMIQPLKQHDARPILADEEGVLLLLQEEVYVLSVFEASATQRFASYLVGCTKAFSVHQSFVSDYLETKGMKKTFRCLQACCLAKERYLVSQTLSFRTLGLSDEDLVLEHYHLTDAAYVRSRLASGVVLGVEVEGKLAGFMGTHQEGSMGMLEIFPDYRRRHLAYELEKEYCNRLLSQQKTPYCHIVEGNMASLALHKKLGFVFASHRIDWFN
jgi:ribosomal protein S18 acetylase RimI-like enzyme